MFGKHGFAPMFDIFNPSPLFSPLHSFSFRPVSPIFFIFPNGRIGTRLVYTLFGPTFDLFPSHPILFFFFSPGTFLIVKKKKTILSSQDMPRTGLFFFSLCRWFYYDFAKNFFFG